MPYSTQEREILDQVVAALHGHYGERLSRVVLFGSRARRDHRDDSDYDILVVLHGDVQSAQERPVLSRLVYPMCWEHDVVIYCIAMPEKRFLEENSMLLKNIKSEGVAL